MQKMISTVFTIVSVVLLLLPKFENPYLQSIKYIGLVFLMWQLRKLMQKIPSKHSDDSNGQI